VVSNRSQPRASDSLIWIKQTANSGATVQAPAALARVVPAEEANFGWRVESRAMFVRFLALPLVVVAFGWTATVAAQVAVSDPWVRGTVAGQTTTGAFMQLKAATDATLVGASSPVAQVVEIHEMKMDAGLMKMTAVERLPLPAGKRVALSPGGYHVMLMGLRKPLAAGEAVPITLSFEDAAGKKTSIEVKAVVRPLGK
jgi:copper(I)-binding protein